MVDTEHVAPLSPQGHSYVRAAPLAGSFGAVEVLGFDVARATQDERVGDWLRRQLWQHAVVCIRLPERLDDSGLRSIVGLVGTVKELVATTNDGAKVRYGETRQVIDSGFVLTEELREQLGDVDLGGDDVRPGLFTFFHTDDSYVARPAAATVLHARQLPADGGGDTQFIDMRAAYALLDAEDRTRLVGKWAVHAYDNHGAFPPRPSASGPLGALPRVAHPIVRAHPATGRPALYFDLDRAIHIDGLDTTEGRTVLQSLQDHAEQFAPRYSHRWQDHDVLIWDNAAVQHRASGDFAVGQPRRFWRFMVEGPQPSAFVPPHE
jgi:alpha-ketoglutarate-dependent taurine dioxygenase